MEDPVIITDYNPDWPESFEEERQRLAALLGPLVERIDHVGSTAVPGLPAKPVIDLLAAVPRLEPAETYQQALTSLGYTGLRILGDPPERLFLKRGQPRAFHLHIVRQGSLEQRRHIAFRDYLRRHPDLAQEYGALKHALALELGSDRKAYTEAKRPLIQFIEGLAGCPGATSQRLRLETDLFPRLDLRLVAAFDGLGGPTVEVQGGARAQQFHFVDATSGGSMRRWLWVQFEGFLPEQEGRYHEPDPDDNPELDEIWLGGQRYLHHAGEIDLVDAQRQNPDSDWALAQRFLALQGVDLGSELVFHRFFRVLGPERRKQVMILYAEPEGPDSSPEEVLERALTSFTVLPHLKA